MTRWILDIVRLLVFCSVFLLAATTLLADEEKKEGESRSFGLKIEIEDGEINVEQTGDADLDDLSEIIESKIAQVVEQIASDGKIQVRAKAMLKDGSKALKDLPIGEMLDALGDEIDLQGNQSREEDVEIKVHVNATDDGGDAQHRAIFVAGDGENDEDILEVIKGLKQKLGGSRTWVEKGDAGEHEAVRVRVHSIGGSGHATHRLGVTISGPAGIAVADVTDGSAAQVAGIESGDLIISVDGDRCENVGDLIGEISEAGQEGNELELVIVRDGETIELSVSPEEIKDAESEEGAGHHEHDGPDSDELSERGNRKAREGRERGRDRAVADAKRHYEHAREEAMAHAKHVAERAMREAKRHHARAEAMAKSAVARAAKHDSGETRKALRAAAKEQNEVVSELREQMNDLRAAVEELREEIADDG